MEHQTPIGLDFTLGQIEGIDSSKDKVGFELLLVKICPRKTFPCIATKQTLSEDFKLPDGFDSIYFKDPNADPKIYQHKFKVFKKSQTLPVYLIQFNFNANH